MAGTPVESEQGSAATLAECAERALAPPVSPAGEHAAPVGVILAGNSRGSDGSSALMVVAGTTLLERAVGTFRAVGVEEIVVVLGRETKPVRNFLRRRQIGVRTAEHAEFVTAGSSGFAACTADRGFLLLKAEHIVEPEAVRRLLLRRDAPFVLAVDTQPRLADVNGATKIALEEGFVASISPDLVAWDAVDAGLALCSPAVAEAAARCYSRGEPSWDVVKRRWLAEGGAVEAVDLAGLFWIEVKTAADRRRAERAIVRLAAR